MEATSGLDLTEFFNDWFFNQGYPSHTIQYNQVANEVFVQIHQSQSHSSVDFFELTLPLLFTSNTQDTLITFPLSQNDQNFSFNLDFEIQNIVYDPDKWILSANNQITLGIDEMDIEKGLAIYPNPASDQLTLLFEDAVKEDQRYKIYDVSGKLVKEGDLGMQQKTVLNIQGLEVGYYVLSILNNTGETNLKFIVNK